MNLNQELEKALKEKRKKKDGSLLKKRLRVYVVPIVALTLFFGTIIFLVIPRITSILDSLQQISAKSSELKSKLDDFNKLQVIVNNSEKLRTELSIINSLAPSGETEVVEFQNRIAALALSNSVIITSQKFNDTRIDIIEGLESNLLLKEVPSVFNIVGSYQNILNFISQLSTLTDFVVVQSMELSSRNSEALEDNWFLDLTLVKYQFGIVDELLAISEYIAVPVDAILSTRMQEYIDSRKQSQGSTDGGTVIEL